MTLTNPGNVEEIVVDYLRHARPSSRSPEIEDAVQYYIATCDEVAQDRILSRWVTRTETRVSSDRVTSSHKRRRTDETGELSQAPNQQSHLRPHQQQKQAPHQESSKEPDLEADERSNRGEDHESDHRPDDPSNEEPVILERKAVTFFGKRRREEAQNGETPKPALTWKVAKKAIQALRAGYEWTCENDVCNLWRPEDPITACEQPGGSTPLQRLTALYGHVLSSEHSNEVKRRITALLMHHECKENRIALIRGSGRGNRNVKEREFTLTTGLPFETATVVNNTAYAWMKFIRAWGLGGLVLPGPGYRGVFERQLSAEHTADLWAFCEIHMPDLAVKVGSMHNTVKNLFMEAVRIYKGNEQALEQGTRSPLAKLYRTHWTQGTSQSLIRVSSNTTCSDLSLETHLRSTRLETLAEVAYHELRDEGDDRASATRTHPNFDMSGTQNNNIQGSATTTAVSQGFDPRMTNYHMYSRDLPPGLQSCDRGIPPIVEVADPLCDRVTTPDLDQFGGSNSTVDPLWDWDNLIQGMYAHLGEGCDVP